MLRTEGVHHQMYKTMNDICRLCCSSSFVRNDIFEPGDGLHAKMALYMPFQVHRGDQLPQRVCDACRARVLELHYFCSEALRAQHRLQTALLLTGEPSKLNEQLDLSAVKRCPSPPPHVDRATQTEPELPVPQLPSFLVSVKQEPVDPAALKVEADTNHTPNNAPILHSDDSDNVSLISLKKKKRKKKHKKEKSDNKNEDFKGKKRKKNIKDWEILMSALPKGTTIGVVGSEGQPVQLKQESDSDGLADLPPSPSRGPGSVPEQYTCCVCLGKFYSHTTMLEHYMSHRESVEGEEPPPVPAAPSERCPRCGKPLPPGAWPEHWRRHWLRDRRPYRCTLCELTFRKPQQILKHGQLHEQGDGEAALPGKRYVCDHCSEEFVYMRYLLAHRSRAHPAAAGTALALRCAVCARQFRHLNSLRRHQRAHAGERTHLCNMCGKALSSREHLKFHIRIHTGYKPNVCNTCGKGFAKKCNLTLHERTHSGEKPHVCAVCHKAFSQRSTLVIHERYHSGARPYVCSLCGRGFVAKGLLSMHLKTTCV